MSECEFCHEDFCILEGNCSYQGEDNECMATEEDLLTICNDCFKPEEECECNGILKKIT